jgi:hypothetical protein
MRCAPAGTAAPARTADDGWCAYSDIARAVPALNTLLDVVRGYVLLNTPPEQIFFAAQVGARACIRQVLADARSRGVLLASLRTYRAHRHNYVINKHRQNALQTFRAFSQQANADPATKSAVLLQATQCIFAPQATGYTTQEADSNYSPIIEIVRAVTGDKK